MPFVSSFSWYTTVCMYVCAVWIHLFFPGFCNRNSDWFIFEFLSSYFLKRFSHSIWKGLEKAQPGNQLRSSKILKFHLLHLLYDPRVILSIVWTLEWSLISRLLGKCQLKSKVPIKTLLLLTITWTCNHFFLQPNQVKLYYHIFHTSPLF